MLNTMKREQFHNKLDELMELEAGTISDGAELSGLIKWDSLALMGFIAMMDQRFGLIIPAARIAECKTVGDLADLAGDHIN